MLQSVIATFNLAWSMNLQKESLVILLSCRYINVAAHQISKTLVPWTSSNKSARELAKAFLVTQQEENRCASQPSSAPQANETVPEKMGWGDEPSTPARPTGAPMRARASFPLVRCVALGCVNYYMFSCVRSSTTKLQPKASARPCAASLPPSRCSCMLQLFPIMQSLYCHSVPCPHKMRFDVREALASHQTLH